MYVPTYACRYVLCRHIACVCSTGHAGTTTPSPATVGSATLGKRRPPSGFAPYLGRFTDRGSTLITLPWDPITSWTCLPTYRIQVPAYLPLARPIHFQVHPSHYPVHPTCLLSGYCCDVQVRYDDFSLPPPLPRTSSASLTLNSDLSYRSQFHDPPAVVLTSSSALNSSPLRLF
jgi:hypothetical protein